VRKKILGENVIITIFFLSANVTLLKVNGKNGNVLVQDLMTTDMNKNTGNEICALSFVDQGRY
jgi:hypothetical protein